MKPSSGTTWSRDVRAHVATHYHGCIGPLVGMLGSCVGGIELDHIRASHGTGMKSDSIAPNAAPLCAGHHAIKTKAGRTWRPLLIALVQEAIRGCEACEAEYTKHYGPLEDEHAGHVDPCGLNCRASVPPL
jgi:hypothetical protein